MRDPALGGEVVLFGDAYDQAAAHARELGNREVNVEQGANLVRLRREHGELRVGHLEPVLANLALDLQLAALGCDDMSLTAAEFETGREQAHWVVMARDPAALAGFAKIRRWLPLEGQPRVGVWTDDFSSPVRVWQR